MVYRQIAIVLGTVCLRSSFRTDKKLQEHIRFHRQNQLELVAYEISVLP